MATAVEAEEKIRREVLNQKTDVVIFMSRDMGWWAKKFAAAFPEKKILVFTGLVPEGEVIWVDKWLIADPQNLRDIVLN